MAYEDLLKDTSVADTSNNYFTLTITDLNPNTSYPIELRWKYKDGTFSNWGAVKRLPAKALIPAPPSLPSVPTLKRVVGAIEISWDGKTSNGANQPPTSFVDAEIYISTTSDFTPIKGGATNNYIDILDFANGQNTLNIGVGTVVNPTFTIDYGIDYYVKIRSRNSENVYSSPVTANGSPIKVGQLSDAGLIEVKADKITTGTLQSNSTITVGATSGKHVVIRGTGNPLSIYGSGGSTTSPILDFDETGNLSIKGTITATGGVFEGSMSAGNMRIGKRVNYIDIVNQKQVIINPAHWYGGEPLDGIFIGTSNYWYNDGKFKVGSTNKNLTFENGNLSITNTGTVSAGLLQENITTTLNSNGLFSIISDGDSFFDWGSAAISVETQIKHTKLYPGQMTVSLDTNTDASTIGSSFSIFHDGMGNVNFLLGDFNTYTPLRWINYDFYSVYDASYIYGISIGNVGDATDATRSLVVTGDGTQYVGHRNYYGNRTSSNMASATFGVDGDFYYSTSAS